MSQKPKRLAINHTQWPALIRLRWTSLVLHPKFAGRYVIFAAAVLLLTTLYWSIESARLQLANADQLVNPYLLSDAATFKQATYPAAHSFLIKWPLFWLVKSFAFTGSAYIGATIAIVLLTTVGLALLLYRIERRPLVFGTLCLALSSVLVLIPAQPYAGGLLPVNMAMLATRNIEYLIFIGGLLLIIKSSRLRGWTFWSGVGLLALLAASDRLFLILGVGGAALALIAYSLTHHWKMVSLSVKWLLGSLAAGIGGILLLWLAAGLHAGTFKGQGGATYGLISSVHDLALGIIYGVMGLLTNFGANPAYDATRLSEVSIRLQDRLISVAGAGYLVNFLLLIVSLIWAGKLLRATLIKHNNKPLDKPATLATVLLWISLAASLVFITTHHYYAVDARYLGIWLFSLFITAAVKLRRHNWSPQKLTAGGLILVLVIISSLLGASHDFSRQNQSLKDMDHRNKLIVRALKNHPVDALVGDYWRVIPTKHHSRNQLNVMPLASCDQLRLGLSSQNWQVDLNKRSFAYLLSLDKGLTDFPPCTLDQVIGRYGSPNTSAVIAGDLNSPKELLLFYDNGAHHSAPPDSPLQRKPATITPIELDELPYTRCNGPTILNVVAHQDDDLLFLSPDLVFDVQAGHCVRTVYVTAGDDGGDKFYWLSRQRGSEAAYSKMIGNNNGVWIERVVKLQDHSYVTVANLKDNPKISLIFMHLPDGNLQGQGFKASNHESLIKLLNGKLNSLHSVDRQSSYNFKQLVDGLSAFMHLYQPAEIRTQANYESELYPDHSDHIAVGRFTQRAYTKYEAEQYENRLSIPLSFYIGYPIHEMEANIEGEELALKQEAFLSYARFDSAVCGLDRRCLHSSIYGTYISRQYKDEYAGQ